jgi:hypothetical protein
MKTLMQFIYQSVLILLLISCGNNNSPTVTVINNPDLLNAAKSLSTEGQLKVTKQGYVYLKVSDDYIKILYPILVQHEDAKDAPCIAPARSPIGTHITLFYEGALSLDEINSLPLGKTFKFQVKEIEKVNQMKLWHQLPEKLIWYVIVIDSPELSSNLKPLMMVIKYKLHISIARENFYPSGVCIKRHTFYHRSSRYK